MKKFIATALIALSALSGIAASAQAGYFGDLKSTQDGQHATGTFGDIEKSGI